MTITLRKTHHDEECMGIISLGNGDQLLAYGVSTDDECIKEMCFVLIDGSGEVIDNHLIKANTALTLPSNSAFTSLVWEGRWVERLNGYYVAIVLFEGGK